MERNEIKVVKFDSKHSTAATVEGILQRETGYPIKLNQANLEVERLASLDEMRNRFAEVAPSGRNSRVAINTK